MWLAGVTLACAVTSPAAAQLRDACALLDRQPEWRAALEASESQWGVSPGVVLAVLDQESRLRADARGQGAAGPNPPRNFGFAQANIRTWSWFLRDSGWTGSTSRTDFAASAWFVGWHFARVGARNGLAPSDTAGNYLIYKLGEGGYRRGAPAVSRRIAATVVTRAGQHDAALATCPADPPPH